MSPGDIDRFLGGDDDQWPEDEGKAQWPKEKMSAGDVDAFLGPDSPGNDSDSSDGAEAPPPPSSSASSVAPPLDADDAAEIAAMASSSDPFGAPANPFAAPAARSAVDSSASTTDASLPSETYTTATSPPPTAPLALPRAAAEEDVRIMVRPRRARVASALAAMRTRATDAPRGMRKSKK